MTRFAAALFCAATLLSGCAQLSDDVVSSRNLATPIFVPDLNGAR